MTVIVENLTPAQSALNLSLPGNDAVKAIIDTPIGEFCQTIEHRVQYILVAVC